MAAAALTNQVVSRAAFLGSTVAPKNALRQEVGVCHAKVSMGMSFWSKAAKGLVATGASVLLAASAASAATVKLGSDSGELIFVPQELTVASGEVITFQNNAGFPHNVVIDEGPDGVDVDALSHEDYLNGPGESITLTLSDKGSYNIICQPHEKGGMKMVINVQ